jgi:branched-chain amino acid transport system ATP-binding protein
MTASAIEFKDLHKSFGNTEIIRGVELAIEKDRVHAIIGPNGAGKSTLYNLVTGLHPVTAGRIFLHGRMGLSRSFQVTNIFHRMSVFENIRCGLLWNRGYRYSFWRFLDHQRDLNELTGLASRREVPAGLLSYSDQRALEIAITLASGADVILLDEPTAGMSRGETEQTVELVRRIAHGRTLVIVEHDMSVVFDLAETISVLVYGRVIAIGTPAEIRANRLVKEAYLGSEVS